MIKRNLLLFLLLATFPLPGFPQNDTTCSFTDSDMESLTKKLQRALHGCKQLSSRPDVLVEVTNETDQFVDKTKFASLIHSALELKTHVKPDSKPAQLEIRARLIAEARTIHRVCRTTYQLSAEVTQAGESFCRKSVKITKRSGPSP